MRTGRCITCCAAALAAVTAAPVGAAAAAAAPAVPRAVADGNIARVVSRTEALARPGAGRRVAVVEPLAPLGGGATQLRIVGRRTAGGRRYLQVLLPQRPNGARGWIPADRAQVLRTRYRVTIARAARRLTVTLGGRVVHRARIIVGASASPTPAGRFAISEELRGRADRFTGSWVLPLTAFSGTYRQFAGGPGRVAIHGRGGASLRDPLGTARSHGCIRVANRTASWLADHLQPGVPVTVQ